MRKEKQKTNRSFWAFDTVSWFCDLKAPYGCFHLCFSAPAAFGKAEAAAQNTILLGEGDAILNYVSSWDKQIAESSYNAVPN